MCVGVHITMFARQRETHARGRMMLTKMGAWRHLRGECSNVLFGGGEIAGGLPKVVMRHLEASNRINEGNFGGRRHLSDWWCQ